MVELGGYVGYSAILFGEAMAKAAAHAEPSGGEASEGKGMGKGGVRFYSIEANPTFAEISRDFVRLAGLENVVSVEVGKAEDVLRQLVSEGKLARGQVDVFFLDHIEELYKQDFRLAWEELGLLRKGSYAVADNVLVPGAPEYRAFVRAQEGRLESYGVKGLIIPGDIEVSSARVLSRCLRNLSKIHLQREKRLTCRCRTSWRSRRYFDDMQELHPAAREALEPARARLQSPVRVPRDTWCRSQWVKSSKVMHSGWR